MTFALFAVVIVLAAFGCSSKPVDLGPVREQAAATQLRLSEAEAGQRAALDAAKASGDTEAAAKAEKALATIAEAKKATATAEGILTQATNPDGSFNPEGAAGAAGSALMVINPLLGVGVTVIGGLLGAAWKQREATRAKAEAEANLKAANQIVGSIEAAKKEIPEFRAAFAQARNVLFREQDKATQDVVEAAKGG